eukprot:GHVU01028445.1.p3 GENE.GHVU01028445.1~~GHVU01028445.1.p3  ORF type:complete len:109 (+),score=1.71 GHVU01028445.1:155-481(+)
MGKAGRTQIFVLLVLHALIDRREQASSRSATNPTSVPSAPTGRRATLRVLQNPRHCQTGCRAQDHAGTAYLGSACAYLWMTCHRRRPFDGSRWRDKQEGSRKGGRMWE